jgi:UDP-N-acetylmuramoylalanine--D-glutamate ligase
MSALHASLQGKNIVILGYGINNQELTAYLLRQGLHLTLRDTNPVRQEEFMARHPEYVDAVTWQIMPDILKDIDAFDILFRSPGVRYSAAPLQKAIQQGAIVTSQTKFFLELCPAETIGVTGTKGKGTTCSLIYNILKEGYTQGAVYLGGNIGVDPFSFLEELTEQDIVVLELSSYQLIDLHISPHIGVVLKVTPDHLDVHASYEEYRGAKANVIAHQQPNDIAIINIEQPELGFYAQQVHGKAFYYSKHTPSKQSAWAERIDGEEIVFVQMGNAIESFAITNRILLGEHNLENILPAVLIGTHYRISAPIMQAAITSFKGLEHRISFVGTFEDVSFYDDSIATTPESAIVAMEAFAGRRIHLLLGGKTGGQAFDEVAEEAVARCATVSFIPGKDTPALEKLFRKVAKRHSPTTCTFISGIQDPIMETILSGIQPHLQPGDVVLLSPAAKSFDHFKDYKDRGDAFVKAIHKRYNQEKA